MTHPEEIPNCNSEKCCQIRNWIKAFLKTPSEVFVGEYAYQSGSGTPKTKSVICILNMFPEKGIICIDKPIDEILPSDIIPLYKTLRQEAV